MIKSNELREKISKCLFLDKPMIAVIDDLEDLYKQEIEKILDLNIFANKYSSKFVNKGILMAYGAIKEHIEGKKEEPKGEQSK